MSETSPHRLLLVAGPTASGKSELALRLAEEFGGTIINADSMQIYRDLAILTARPGPAEERRAPHRLYGILDAAEACSVGRWRALALAEIAAAAAAGRLPILVGGTGLYFQALLYGLAAVPEIAPEVRAGARALHAEMGGEGFRDGLARLDPETAARLPAGDTQRLIRAYEVVIGTGVTLPEWQRRQERAADFDAAGILLLPPRAALYAACDARLAAMREQGVLAEVAALVAQRLPPELPAMKAVGLREFAAQLEGRLDPAAALAAAQQATRRYAKRQYTWLRHRLLRDGGVPFLPRDAKYSERMLPEIFAYIRGCLLTDRS